MPVALINSKLGKFVRGAGATLSEAMLAEHRAQIMAERDAKLEEYRNQAQAQQNQFQVQQGDIAFEREKELLGMKSQMGLNSSENDRRFTRNYKVLEEEGALDDSGNLKPEKELTARARMAAADSGLIGRAVSSADITIAQNQDLTGQVASSKGQIAGAEAGAAETAKLEAQLDKLPAVKSAVKMAEEEARIAAERGEEKRLKNITLNMYNTAMKNLSDSLAGTDTGPFAGRLPAVTSQQQIAEGSIAVIAPILKSMFRAAGEGVFTDKDQELLMDMVPKRTDTPDAVEAKIRMLDAVVRAKLSGGEQATTLQPITTQDNTDALNEARAAIDRGASREKVIERLRSMGVDPTGL